MYDESCSFCFEINETSGVEHDANLNLYKKMAGGLGSSSRVIWESENLLLMPTIGCFTEGYCLLVTRDHYFSMAEFARSNGGSELSLVLGGIQNMMNALYNGCIFFEHGAIDRQCKAGGCSDHAHLHIMPKIDNVLKRTQKHHDFVKYSSIDRIKNISSAYLLFYDGEEYYVSTSELVPSQYFRQLLAQEAGIGEKWDWRKHPFKTNIQTTLNSMRNVSLYHLK